MRANLPKGTEVATEYGFIPIEKYSGERLIVVEGRLEASFQPAYHLAKEWFDGWMVQIGGIGLRLIARPEQQIACSTWVDGGAHLWSKPIIEIEDTGSRFVSPLAVDSFEQEEMDISDEELALSALITVRLSEMNARSFRLERCRKPEAELIVSLCQRLNIEAHSTEHFGYYNVFIDRHEISPKIFFRFPHDILTRLSKRQMEIVLDSLGSCGSDVRRNEEEVYVWSVEPWIIDVVMIMSILCGHKAHLLRYDRPVRFLPRTYRDVRITTLKCHRTKRKKLRLYTKAKSMKIVDYTGEVYSLYVPKGYIIVRQDRAISIIYAAKD